MYDKQDILDSMRISRAGMRAVNSCIKTFPELSEICQEIVEAEQNNIKQLYIDLVELVKQEVSNV